MPETNPPGTIREEYYAIRTETVSELRKVVESLKSAPENGKNSELLAEIRKLEAELKRLKKTKRYGLVWEEKPEAFEAEAKNALPVLEEVNELALADGSEKPQNLIIEGDNFHSLAALSYTHRGLVDVIYIDPPYNTGNKDFAYNDRYVDKEDDFRHSKWLSFMAKRLRLARDLLKESGVIFISIDDNEQAQLKMLCDEVFGEGNFIACLPTIMNLKGNQDEFWFAWTHEYTLVFSKNKTAVKLGEFPILDEEDLESWIEDDYWLFKLWTLKGGGVNGTKEKRPNLFFPIFIKSNWEFYITDNDSPLDENDAIILPLSDWKEMTWRWSKSKLESEPHNIHIKFDSKGLPIISRKIRPWLGDIPTSKPKTTFYKPEYSSWNWTNLLKAIFDEDRKFTNPKPLALIYDVMQISTGKAALVLDCFAGSGTTGHAIMQLNKEDGGNRRFILCSNRENSAENPDKNLCRDVCYERVKRVSQGYANSKGEAVEGLGGNVRYFKTAFVPHSKSTDDLRHAFVDRCSDLLRIKEDCFDAVPGHSDDAFRAYSGNGKNLALVYDPSDLSELKRYLAESSGPVTAYVFAIAQEPFAEELAEWSGRLVLEPIPDGILSTYRKVYGI